MKPPKEAEEPADIVWSLNVTVYGLEEAMSEFDEFFSDQTAKLEHPFRRCAGDPSVFVNELSRHVDDGLAIGTEEDLSIFFAELEGKFALKTFPLIGSEEQQHLGVHVCRTSTGFRIRNRDELLEDMLGLYDLTDAKPTIVPGTKAEARREGEIQIEEPERKTRYRTAVGKALFYGRRRPDAQFATKECARPVGQPTEDDEKRMKKLLRYYAGTRSFCLHMNPVKSKTYLVQTFVDSDWAGDRVTRKSTSGVAVTVNKATVLTFPRTQQTIAHSAAEAELNAIISGSCESLGIKLLLEEMKREVSIELRSDSTSGISIASRLGQGRLKHLELRQLAIQEWVKRRLLKLSKVDTAHNHSDILTKNLPPKCHEYHRDALGIRDIAMAIAVLAGRPQGGGAFGVVTRGLHMCLAGLLGLLTAADANGVCERVVVFQEPTHTEDNMVFLLVVVVLALVVLVISQACWIWKARRATTSTGVQTLVVPVLVAAAAAPAGSRRGLRQAVGCPTS